jgi:very-short-patch-repair endonuclease
MVNKEYLALYPDAKIYSDAVMIIMTNAINNRDSAYKEKLSQLGKKRWENSEYRERQSKSLKLAQGTDKAIRNHRAGALKYFEGRTEEQRNKHVESLKKSWVETKSYRREKLKEAHNKEETKKKHSQATKVFFESLSDKEREQRKNKLKERWEDPIKGVELRKISKINLLLATTEEAKHKRHITEGTLESKLKRRIATAANLSRMPRRSSLNERFSIALNDAGLFPKEEYLIDFYTVDFCFPDKKIVVEVDGDYWHCNPAIYPIPKNSQQRKSVGKDKSEKTFLTNRGWTLLRFWEKDINEDIDSCIKKVSGAFNECEY